jgi:DNA primase
MLPHIDADLRRRHICEVSSLTHEMFSRCWRNLNRAFPDRAGTAGSKTVIVVEGYFDCMRVHQAGFPWMVALMGSSLSAAQESSLLGHFERVVLMMDGDAAGRAASAAIAVRLSGRRSVQVVRLPDGSQPDQLSSSTIRQLLAVVGCPNEGAMVKQNLSPA